MREQWIPGPSFLSIFACEGPGTRLMCTYVASTCCSFNHPMYMVLQTAIKPPQQQYWAEGGLQRSKRCKFFGNICIVFSMTITSHLPHQVVMPQVWRLQSDEITSCTSHSACVCVCLFLRGTYIKAHNHRMFSCPFGLFRVSEWTSSLFYIRWALCIYQGVR